MKLEKILSNLNSLEKNSFIKIIVGIISNGPKQAEAIDKLLADTDKDGIKSLDNIIISRIFDLVKNEFTQIVKGEFVNTQSQLDILIDILIRDGNCIMKQDWFARLYELELNNLENKINNLATELGNGKSEISTNRKRDYQIYQACVNTAFLNDVDNNRDSKITDDELSILLTLANKLELSQEEVKLINYMTLPTQKLDIECVINDLKNLGILFFSRKTNTVYIADEMVRLLRKLREKEIADKYFRRILRLLREPQLNLICRKHNIDWKLPIDAKIKEIINEGISFKGVLTSDIHKDDASLTEKKNFLNEFWTKNLNLKPALKGTTIEDKIENIVEYFDTIEKDEKVGISVDGYEKLLIDLSESLPIANELVKNEFELQDEQVLKSALLLDYNIKPRDILDVIPDNNIIDFCNARGISTRGNDIDNILNAYKDSENLFLENYVNFAYRDLNALKINGVIVKEVDIGLKFEELTKSIFTQLGFNVDEGLKKKLNTAKDKIDILLNLGDNNLILIECKTVKESGYNKFSAVARQMKSYTVLAKKNDYNIIKSLLIAPDFSDDFINETELEYELNLSLITANSLLQILDGFKNSSKHKQFPYKLLMRDVLIQEDRIIKAMGN